MENNEKNVQIMNCLDKKNACQNLNKWPQGTAMYVQTKTKQLVNGKWSKRNNQ